MSRKGQPTLVGTVSVENSELIARRLQREGVPHNVLNAKYHEREAEIVAQAGRKGAVTIATNMAGRGTDILLGGNPDFMAREFLKKEEIDPDEATDEQWAQAFARPSASSKRSIKEVVGSAGCTSSARSVTNRAASITSFAVAQADRATPDRLVSSSRWKTI